MRSFDQISYRFLAVTASNNSHIALYSARFVAICAVRRNNFQKFSEPIERVTRLAMWPCVQGLQRPLSSRT